MSAVLGGLIEPGFFTSSPVRVALAVSSAVAVVSAVIGVITVLRGQSFAGHALADVGTTGGSAAFLVGVSPLWGFVAAGLAGAGLMEALGVRRARSRDLATGVVLGGALGLSALLLYLDTTHESTTGATMTILFGSMFAIAPSTVPVFVVLCAAALASVVVIFRPLLLSAIDPDLAVARGTNVEIVGLLYFFALAVAVSLACVTIGAILSTTLLIGPAATALRFARRPASAVVVAVLVALFATWSSIVLAYDSFYWAPVGRGWPVSFFVAAIVFLCYLLAGLFRPTRRPTGVL